MSAELLIISPVRNEAAHIERAARAVAAQTKPPTLWVVVDDGSDDGTRERLERLRPMIPFLQIVSAPRHDATEGSVDRLAMAAAPRTFNVGLNAVRWQDYAFVGKLDGDIELPPDYFERLLARFDEDPTLGLAGGVLVENAASEWRRIRIPDHHVHGALKLYRRECFQAIGGICESLGWDTIDGTYARMRGYTTRSFPDIVARHHRHWGSADGTLRGRARHGLCAHIAGYTPLWILLRSLKLATVQPYGLSGIAFLFGYLRARLSKAPRVEDLEYRRYVRRELRERMLGPLTRVVTQTAP